MTVLQDPLPSRADGVFMDMVLQSLLRSVIGGSWGFSDTRVSFKKNTVDDNDCQLVVMHVFERKSVLNGLFVIRSKGLSRGRQWECGLDYLDGKLVGLSWLGDEEEMIQQLTLAKIAGWLD